MDDNLTKHRMGGMQGRKECVVFQRKVTGSDWHVRRKGGEGEGSQLMWREGKKGNYYGVRYSY